MLLLFSQLGGSMFTKSTRRIGCSFIENYERSFTR